MNTKMMEQFEIMDTDLLETVGGEIAIREILPKQVLGQE